MATAGPRYSVEEFARRGPEIYHRDIEPHLKAEDVGKFVAIDIETGQWEMDASDRAACERLRSRIPTSQTWVERVGHKAVHTHVTPRLTPAARAFQVGDSARSRYCMADGLKIEASKRSIR